MSPLADRIGKILAVITEVNTSVTPPVAHVRETTTGGSMVVNLSNGPAGTWVTPNVGETWWIQFLGSRWSLLSRYDTGRGQGDNPGTSDYLKLIFQVSEQETELIYKAVVNFNSAAVNNTNNEISHYIISWVTCTEDGTPTDKANQYLWYPNRASDGEDIAVDPDTNDQFDYIAVIPYPIENPKTTYYKARIRAAAKVGVLGEWTEWTTPALPIQDVYNLPPEVEKPKLAFQVFENEDGTLRYNASVRFKDVGYWDLPGGDFADDIDRYEIQLQPLELNAPTYGTLNSTINSTITTPISISSIAGSGIPTDPTEQFYISIDSEVMLVTNRSGSNWTVVRGQEFTTASAHSKDRAVKQYISNESVSLANLFPSPKEEVGTLDEPQVVADADDNENWPLLGVLSLPEPEDDSTAFLSPTTTTFNLVIAEEDSVLLESITPENIAQGIYLAIDSEFMKLESITNLISEQYTIEVERGVKRNEVQTQKSNHEDGAKIYLQTWIPIFELEDSIALSDNIIKVALFGLSVLPDDFIIKIHNEQLRVISKKYTGINSSGKSTYEFTVYRGIQNTGAQVHDLATGYLSIGQYYTHLFTSIPSPDNYWWRARVRAVDRFNRKGPWSDWTEALKASAFAGALPPAPKEVALDFTRSLHNRELSLTAEVSYNGVQYEIAEGDEISDVAGYQARLFHSDGAYLKESIANLSFDIIDRSLTNNVVTLTLNPTSNLSNLVPGTKITVDTISSPSNTSYDDIFNGEFTILSVSNATTKIITYYRFSETNIDETDVTITGTVTLPDPVIKVVEPPRTGTNQRQLSALGNGYILISSKIPPPGMTLSQAVAEDFYEIMYVRESKLASDGTHWEYKVSRGSLNTRSRRFVIGNNPIYIFYFPPQTETTNVGTDEPRLEMGDVKRYVTSFYPVRKQWWYLAQVRTIDTKNRVGAWSKPSSPGTPSDTVRPPVPYNINVIPYPNDTVKIDWDAPLEPGMTIPLDILSLLGSDSSLSIEDFEMLTTDISYFKVQLWSEDPHQEIPLNAKSFGINSIAKSSSTVTFTTDIQQNIQVNITSCLLKDNVATLFTSVIDHGVTVGKSILVSGINANFNGTYIVTAVGAKSISYSKVASNISQANCTGIVTFNESLQDWFSQGQSIYIENCLPQTVSGQQTILALTDSTFTITKTISEEVSVEDEAIVRPFDAIQASDYYSTYPIHYFVQTSKASLANCVTAVQDDICLVTEDVAESNQGYWKLTGSNPSTLSSWSKIADNDFEINSLLFFDKYVGTTSRTVSSEALPKKVWARICSVDDSGNTSAWVAAGPFFTQDIYRPDNVLLDFDDSSAPGFSSIIDGGIPSTQFTISVDGGLPDTIDFAEFIDGTPTEAGSIDGLNIQWTEIVDDELSVSKYEVELQGGRLFAQVWQDQLNYWANTTSQDIIYGGLSNSVDDIVTTLSVTELSNVPAPEFYIKIGDEMMYVEQIVRDWADENQNLVAAVYSVRRGVLGTTATPHDAAAIVYRVQVEPLRVLEIYSPASLADPFEPFDVTIEGEKITVVKRTPDPDSAYGNIYFYECLRKKETGRFASDFEHDGINYRIPIFDSLIYSSQIIDANSDATDQDDLVTAHFDISRNDVWYRGKVRSIFQDGEIGVWSNWTFWADPTDLTAPEKPILDIADFNTENTPITLDLAWSDGFLIDNPFEPTIFNDVASEAVMLNLNASAGDIAVLHSGANLQAYLLVANPASDMDNWRSTLIPLTNIDTAEEAILPEGSDKIGGSIKETDYYEVQVSRVPKEGKSISSEGSLGVLLKSLPDGTAAGNPWRIEIDPLKVFPKYPKEGDKLQIVTSNLIETIVTVQGTSTQNETQKISLLQPNMSGTWQTSFDDSLITNGISYDASPETVRLAIAALGTNTNVSFINATNVVSLSGHGLSNGTPIFFAIVNNTPALSSYRIYYVIDSQVDTFKISTTLNGTAVNLIQGKLVTDPDGTGILKKISLPQSLFDFNDTADTVRLSNHGFTNNDIVSFNALSANTGLSANTNYYVKNADDDTFQLCTAPGGSTINMPGNGKGLISSIAVTKPSLGVWQIKFLVPGNQPEFQAISTGLGLGYDSTSEVVEMTTPLPTEAEWASSKVTLYVLRSNSGTSTHAAGSLIKWIDVTSGDFLNNYEVSFEYIYLWQYDPFFLETFVSYLLDDIGDYLYAARIRARDAAGNSSDWVEISIRPDGLPIPQIVDLEFSQLGGTEQALDAELTFDCDISPEYNITHFVPELMPSLRVPLLNPMDSSSIYAVIPVDSGLPNPALPADGGIGPFYGFIEDEIVLITARERIETGFQRFTSPVYKLTVVRNQMESAQDPADTQDQDPEASSSTSSLTHASGCWFEWFYHPTAKQIEYGISYTGAISTADVYPDTGTLIGDNLAEFVAAFNDVIKPGRWYQGRAKSMSGTVSSSWSDWSRPLRAYQELSLATRPPAAVPPAPTPNPVRSLIIDVDAKRINVSWLPPKPTISTTTTESPDSINIASMEQLTPTTALVVTETAHKFYSDGIVEGVPVPADEVVIQGAYEPFNGTFEVLGVPVGDGAVLDGSGNPLSFIIPIEFGDEEPTYYPMVYPDLGYNLPIDAAKEAAVVTLRPREVDDGSEIDHYIVSIKKAKKINGQITPTLPQLINGSAEWRPYLQRKLTSETQAIFRMSQPTAEVPYYARVFAVNKGGKVSEARYAKGDRIRPPRPRILDISIRSTKVTHKYYAMITLDQQTIITDSDVSRYRVQWFISKDAKKDPAEIKGHFSKSVDADLVKAGKKIKVGHLQPTWYLFVRIRAVDEDNNYGYWTIWKRKRVVSDI